MLTIYNLLRWRFVISIQTSVLSRTFTPHCKSILYCFVSLNKHDLFYARKDAYQIKIVVVIVIVIVIVIACIVVK
jgi:hypothetical protein